MPRTLGSRNKKFTETERLEANIDDTAEPGEIKAALEEAEEKISSARPLPDEKNIQEILQTHTVRNPNRGGSKTVHKDKMDLPPAIDMMEEGELKSKTIRAAAQAALLLGTPPAQVALQYGLPQNTVFQWQDTIITAGAIGRRDKLSDQLMIFIEQELKSLMTISIITSNESWVKRQSASELAHYVAVKTDRLLLLLQAFGRVEESRKRYVEQLEVIEQNI